MARVLSSEHRGDERRADDHGIGEGRYLSGLIAIDTPNLT